MASIRECDESHTLTQLKTLAKQAGLSSTGTKKALCARLINAGVVGMSTSLERGGEGKYRFGIGKQARVPATKLKELIDNVPDIDDPARINYWVELDDYLVYLEGWSDECLAGTGFPPIADGEWDRKVAYIKDLTPAILERKAKERNLEFLEGGFVEKTDEDYSEYLYGVTYGVYRR